MRLDRLSISTRLFLSQMVPLAGLLVFAIIAIVAEFSAYTGLERVRPMVRLADQAGDLIHELQKERGQSVGFLSSGGDAQFAQLLARQRGLTDARLTPFRGLVESVDWTSVDPVLNEMIQRVVGALGEIERHRRQVDGQQLTVPQNIQYYTVIIDDLITVFAQMTKQPIESELLVAITTYQNLVQAKEKAGLERAVGGNLFNRGGFDPALHVRYLDLLARENAYLTEFRRIAQPEVRALYDRTVRGPAVDTYRQWREILVTVGETGDTQGINGATWFQKATVRIDQMKTVEDQLAEQLRVMTDTRADRALFFLILSGAALLVVAGLAAGVGYLLARSIAEPIARTVDTLESLAERRTDVAIYGLDRGDEFRDLARATRRILDNNQADMDRAAADARAEQERQEADRARETAVAEEISTLVAAAIRGALAGRLAVADKTGVMRTMGEAVNQLMDTLGTLIDELRTALEGLATGDLTRRIDRPMQGDFARLKDDYNRTVEKLGGLVDDIHAAADAISQAAAEIGTGTADLASRTEAQAASIEQTSAAVEMLGKRVEQTADNARTTNEVSQSMRDVARRGGETVDGVVTALNDIQESSKEVAEVLSLIDEIALQTNLLALNASVEAARAGDAGKGFVVVAAEVRTLAQRAAEAARTIRTLVDVSGHNVATGVTRAKLAGTALTEIVSLAETVADAMTTVSEANREQAGGLREVGAAVTNMDEMTQRNAMMVDKSNAAVQELQTLAAEMTALVGTFAVAGR